MVCMLYSKGEKEKTTLYKYLMFGRTLYIVVSSISMINIYTISVSFLDNIYSKITMIFFKKNMFSSCNKCLTLFVVDLNENGPHRLTYLNNGSYLIKLVGKDQEVWLCWRRCVPLEVSKTLPFQLPLSLPPVCGWWCSPQLLFHCHACIHTAVLPFVMLMDSIVF